ncbi:Thioredoxin domain-containing protein/Evr1_Alr domain-containing protein [Cephalotus follicularis]|uniref:Sulfhydryl oxidase n=1 Tax=Cephalotus follicularis TaxID=3775 RepID=A0A1Q3C657_CEPFO|nr:Thioredoxin domain-containing protein/Evr1_Alr domain-containing protein [Cephalotus follicularis]
MFQICVIRILILNLLLLPLSSKATSSSTGSRSILREISNADDAVDRAVEFNATVFDAVLKDTPATYAVVEFFAHWCPACRNYKPHYEKVARLFNGPDAVHPGIVLMTRVDCAIKINNKLCDKFSVSHYPMLFWSSPSKFVSGGWEPRQEKSDIRVIDDGRTADRLLNWINKQLGSSYGLDDQKFENEHLPSNISDPEQIARAVYDVEEATATAFDIISEHKQLYLSFQMIKSETRASFIKFLQLLVAHHPSRRCRKGSAEVLVNFDDLYPSNMWSSNTNRQEVATGDGKVALGNFQICGKEVPRGYWMFCRGSKNDTRGFSCGLWVLLHSLSVKIDDGESQFAFMSICDFIHNFFICEECRQHFYDMCSSVTSPFRKSRDFALWLWSAHNKINERLMKEEASLGTGDPKFPKLIWPPKQLCPSCYAGFNEWDIDEVFKLLTSYYGNTLVSLYKDKGLLGSDVADGALEDLVASTNALVVPVGAALAIALASCAFGGLACYWRSHQKNRKYYHQLHSLKNI